MTSKEVTLNGGKLHLEAFLIWISFDKKNMSICENKGAGQLYSDCEADQRLCFRYTDSAISLLSKSKISSL